METKETNIEFEVFNLLEKKPRYSRELARQLNLSHTFINRILASYYRKGYLKREKTGRTMVYSLKKTIATKQLLEMSKKQSLLKLIERDKDFKIIIEEVMDKIGYLIKDIDCIILFGSYSSFSQTKDSDIDLFFITNITKNKMNSLIKPIEKKFGKEINIKISAKDHFIRHLNEPLYKEVLEGKPLYNSDFYYYLKWQNQAS